MRKDRIDLNGVALEGENFSDLKLKQLTVAESVLSRCRFEGNTIEQACFGAGRKPSQYSDCSFDRSRITAIAPGIARFVRCSFKECVIRDFFAVTVEFVDCVFSGTIRKAVFQGTVPEEDRFEIKRSINEFRGNDFRDAELIDVAFRGGIDLTKQRLPEGAGYLYVPDAARTLERSRRSIIGWQDLERRRRVLALLKGLELDVEGGQAQLFLTLGSVPRSQREAADLLHQELRKSGAPENA